MLKICTKMESLTEPKIWSIDSAFGGIYWAQELDERDEEYLNKIDKATVIDKNLGTIITPFGAANLKNISSGCKTLMVANHMNKDGIYNGKVIDLDNCGNNVISIFLSDFWNTDIQCILTHAPLLKDEDKDIIDKDATLYLNDKEMSISDFYTEIDKQF